VIGTALRARAWRLGVVLAAALAAVVWAGGFAMAGDAAKGKAAEEPAAGEKPAGAAAAKAGGGGSDEEGDWPCEQKYVAEMSSATIWTGPALGDAMKSWHQNDGLRDIVNYATDETTDEADGAKAIDEFAKKLTGDKRKALTELFAALFETMGDKRTWYQEGVKKYFRRQQEAGQRVNKIQAELRALEQKGVKADDPKLAEMKKDVLWNNRVFDERQMLLPYVCEIPVLLEQKLGAYARAIQAHLGG